MAIWGSQDFYPGGSGSSGAPVRGTAMNPTGATGMGGIMPPAGPGNYNFGASMNTGPTTSMQPGGHPGTTGGYSMAGNNWQSFTNELGKIYGKGIGSALYGFLDTGGGYNSALTQQSVDAQVAAMQHQANLGYGNRASTMGGAGISPNSSVAALETGDYWSNVTAQENAITAEEFFNMWNQSMNRETGLLGSVLGDAAQNKKDSFNLMDWLSQGASTAGGIAMDMLAMG